MPTHEPSTASAARVAPLMPVALAVAAGVVADRYGALGGASTSAWVVVALGLGGVGLVSSRAAWVGRFAVLGAWAALAGGWHHHRWSDLAGGDLARVVSETPRPVWVRGVLRDVVGFRPGTEADDGGGTRAVIDLTRAQTGGGWRATSGRAVLSVKGDRSDLRAGDAVEAAGVLALVSGPLNPGEFDYRAFLRAQGVRLRLSVDDPSGVWRDGSDRGAGLNPARAASRGLSAVRSWSQERLTRGLDPATAPLASALLLGRREGVDPAVNDAFARTGTTHLLAISGLHMQVLALAVGWALLAVGLARRPTFAAVAAATLAYALLVGLMPSVVRSAAMTVTYCVAGLRDRKGQPANTLALAALVTLLLNPAHLFDVGCQLSFLAVGAIVWAVGPVAAYLGRSHRLDPLTAVERHFQPAWRGRLRKAGAWVAKGLTLSTVVWLAALPLVALRFHVVSPVGVLLNVPLIPMTSLALLASGLTLGLSAAWEPLGRPTAWLGAWLLRGTEWLVRWGASWWWGHAFVPEPSAGWVLGFYLTLGLAAAAALGGWRGRGALAGAFAVWAVVGLGLAVAPAALGRPGGPPGVEVLAVGHGLAVLIETGGGRAVLYDCGRMRDPSVGRRVVAPALHAPGVRGLDAVILSHADADHYNGLPDLLDRVPTRVVLVPEGFAGEANPGAAGLLKLVRSRGVPVRTVAAGEAWVAGETRFEIRHPPAGWKPGAPDNARSIVLDVSWRGRRALLTGDIEGDGLAALVAQTRAAGPVDVLLAPHHGGRAANPASLYDWAAPALVVASQRPPPPGSRDALATVDAPVFRTWRRGAVRLIWAAGGVSARGFLDPVQSPSTGDAVESSKSIHERGGGFMGDWRVLAVAAGGFLLGLTGCAGMAVVEWAAWVLVLPGRRPGSVAEQVAFATDPDAPERRLGEPVEAEAADGVRLAGLWHAAGRGVAPGRRRAALLLHGFAEDPSTLGARIEALNRHGWDVAALDTRAHGRSGGDRSSFGGREAGDVAAWIDALTASGRIGPGPLALWGRSMGAAIAARAAAGDPRVAALVMEAPYLDLEETLAVVIRRKRAPASRLLARLIVRRAHALAGVSLTKPRPIDLAPSVAVPTLVVHGADDSLIPSEDARRLARSFPCPAPFIEVAGAGHNTVVDVGGPALLDRIAAFLDDATAETADG